MPTYEYECNKCKKRFDAFQSMTAKHLTKCPGCGGKVTRLLGIGSGIIFKGSGFYQTDYKNPSTRAQGSNSRKNSHKHASKSCGNPKSDGCKGCSMNHDK
ncbi:MAG: FmdB family zinc ribbon protein [Candidatus Omnitrophota bacterium]